MHAPSRLTLKAVKPGKIGWFLFPESYWTPGKIVDYDKFREETLGPENASHDLIPKPPGYETADILVIFYPRSALSGWWTTAEYLVSSQAFQELEDVAIESVTDTLDAGTGEMIRMAYREASDERGVIEEVHVPSKSKPTPSKRTPKSKPVESPVRQHKEHKKVASPVPKRPVDITERRKPSKVIADDAVDEHVPSQPHNSQLPPREKAHTPQKQQPKPARQSHAHSESDGGYSSADSEGSALFLSKEERERLFTNDYTRSPRRKHARQPRKVSQSIPRMALPKPQKIYFTNETDWYIASQKDEEIRRTLRKLQTAHRDIVQQYCDPQKNFVQLSELDFLRSAQQALIDKTQSSSQSRSTVFHEVEDQFLEKAKTKVIANFSCSTLRQRTQKVRWVLPDADEEPRPEMSEQALAAFQIRCRDIYNEKPSEDYETGELFSSYNKYVKSLSGE